MRIFLIGSGGREHAIAWKILQSPRVTQLYLNASESIIEALKLNYPDKSIIFVDISEKNMSGLIKFSVENNINIAVIGNEALFLAGLSDQLRQNNIPVFGPSQLAAEIETSKAFAKDFMQRHNIPTAKYAVFTDFSKAIKYLDIIDYPIVIKASGLASGKGVFLPENKSEAKNILDNLLNKKLLGESGKEIIIEERLEGEEVSLLVFTDGHTIKPMPLARDHKRLLEGNTGPNTGGMGAYAPVQLPADFTIENIIDQTIMPAVKGLQSENRIFTGVLYAGLILTSKGPRVLEFNCRFGDPETQVLLALLSSDLVDIMQACIEGSLAQCHIDWKNQAAVCVILASRKYPEQNTSVEVIRGLSEFENNKNMMIFQAGTKLENKTILAVGGRVLGVTALADTLQEAIKKAYQVIDSGKLYFKNMHYRKDIGKIEDAYANAGVNIAAGNQTVSLMTQAVRSTYGKEVLAGIGAFGGMYHATEIKKMNDPVLVASTDGIGTKVHLAASVNRFKSLGYDIVHHSVNDILVQGAKPLFFLDYLASSKLDPYKMAEIVTGMAEACRSVNCALLGGETAEMPGVYLPNMCDVAGTIVGVVERQAALPKANLKSGDVLLGIASSGPHTNGYSLIRKIFADISLETVFPELGISLAEALLAPHRCYLNILEAALHHPLSPIKGLVHITGGGFFENIPRILPKGLGCSLQTWPVPALFKLIQKQGNIKLEQMYHIFNMGIGMIVITAPENVALLKSLINEPLIAIGKLDEKISGVDFR